MTKLDFRVYDALTGKLLKVCNNVVEEKMPADLTHFVIGSRERKAVVTDNAGLCRVFHVNSGELISKIVRPHDLKERLHQA